MNLLAYVSNKPSPLFMRLRGISAQNLKLYLFIFCETLFYLNFDGLACFYCRRLASFIGWCLHCKLELFSLLKVSSVVPDNKLIARRFVF